MASDEAVVEASPVERGKRRKAKAKGKGKPKTKGSEGKEPLASPQAAQSGGDDSTSTGIGYGGPRARRSGRALIGLSAKLEARKREEEIVAAQDIRWRRASEANTGDDGGDRAVNLPQGSCCSGAAMASDVDQTVRRVPRYEDGRARYDAEGNYIPRPLDRLRCADHSAPPSPALGQPIMDLIGEPATVAVRAAAGVFGGNQINRFGSDIRVLPPPPSRPPAGAGKSAKDSGAGVGPPRAPAPPKPATPNDLTLVIGMRALISAHERGEGSMDRLLSMGCEYFSQRLRDNIANSPFLTKTGKHFWEAVCEAQANGWLAPNPEHFLDI